MNEKEVSQLKQTIIKQQVRILDLQRSQPRDPDVWDDPIANDVTNQIELMPDRPKIVIAVLNWSIKNDKLIYTQISKIKKSHLSAQGFCARPEAPPELQDIGPKYLLILLGFHDDSEVTVCQLFDVLSMMPKTAEVIVYVGGVAKLRIAATKKKTVEKGQEPL